MDNDVSARLHALETKVDAIWKSVEKTRKYFLATLWITVILFVAPLIIALFAIPAVLNSYLGTLGGSSGGYDQAQLEDILELLQ